MTDYYHVDHNGDEIKIETKNTAIRILMGAERSGHTVKAELIEGTGGAMYVHESINLQRWTVTHKPSGLCLGQFHKSKAKAIKCAVALHDGMDKKERKQMQTIKPVLRNFRLPTQVLLMNMQKSGRPS